MYKWYSLGRLISALSLVLLLACNGVDSNKIPVTVNTTSRIPESPELQVMATTPIVADWINQVAGMRLTAKSIIPYNVDPHSYQPGAKDIAKITESDLIFGIGLGYESKWLTNLLKNHPDIRHIRLGEFVPLLQRGLGDDQEIIHGIDHGHENMYDPHFWFDPTRVVTVVEVISRELYVADLKGRDHYINQTAKYLIELNELDNYIKMLLAGIPDDRRAFMTGHQSLGYLNDRYNLNAMQSVIPNVNLDAGLTPEALVNAVRFIKDHDVKVIFLEESYADKSVKAVADETGVRIARGLTVETLSDPNQTYISSMKNSIGAIAENLMSVP